ncbi:hypothetical protein ACSMXN_05945 [Jatrophihabitans sp. DSM 45814]
MTGAAPGFAEEHLYQRLGIVSRALDESSGETYLPINDGLRSGGLLRAAPLGLAFEHSFATYAFDTILAVPTEISLHIRDNGLGVELARSETRIVRLGRSQVVTEGEIRDAHRPKRLIAFGTITWAVTGDAVAGGPSVGTPDLPTDDAFSAQPSVAVLDAVGIEHLPDGCQIAQVTPAIAGPGGILHAGVSQLLCEEEALLVGRKAWSDRHVSVADCTYNSLSAGKVGPFVAQCEVMARDGSSIDCRVSVRDRGNANRPVCYSIIRVCKV